jgi:soluble P-type ATPase
MIAVEIPGRGRLEITHLLLDLNGTLATDGQVAGDIKTRVRDLADRVEVRLLTADTFGTARQLEELGIRVQILGAGDHVAAKARVVRECGPSRTAAVGNGMNDEAMLREAALGIAVIGKEGAAGRALLAADVIVCSAVDALDILRYPQRLVATLRTE